MTTDVDTAPNQDRPSDARPTGRPALRAVPPVLAALLVLGWIALLSGSGSPLADVLKWCVAVALGVLLPGAAVTRACRRAPAPVIEDLAWAAAVGSGVAMLGWFADRVLPVSLGADVFGPLVTVAVLAVPALRRRVLARPAPGWGLGPSLVLSGAVAASFAWTYATALANRPVNPGPAGTHVFRDIMYQLSLVGELRHHIVPTYPPVAGTSLSYHWFSAAIDAHLVTRTGVDPFDSMLRLFPATMAVGVILVLAVVARRLAQRVWAGPVAAVMISVLELSEPSRWSSNDTTVGGLQDYWWVSTPQGMGWIAGTAAAGLLFAYVRRSPADRATPVALLIPLLILSAGSKSSELPVLLCGLLLATGVQVLRRDWTLLRRCALALAGTIAVFLLATFTIYGGSSYGVRKQLWGGMILRAPQFFPPGATLIDPVHSTTALLATSVLFLTPLLPRLLGLGFLMRYRAADAATWISVGTILSGLMLAFLVRHPDGSELYFMQSAYPVGVAGSASGIVLAGQRVLQRRALASERGTASGRPGVSRRVLLAAGVGGLVVVGAVVAAAVAVSQPRSDPATRATHAVARGSARESGLTLARSWLTPTITMYVVLAVLVAVLAVALRRVRGDAATHRAPLIWLVAMALVLGPGLFAQALHYGGTTEAPPFGSARSVLIESHRKPLLFEDAIRAGRYVDAHAAADAVVATNVICYRLRKTASSPCDARNFVAAALTQRRTLVGGWAYSDRVVANAFDQKVAYAYTPFWDRPLLNLERTAIIHPTRTNLHELYQRYHVRWIYATLRGGPVGRKALNHLAELRFAGPSTAVWQLRP